MRILFWAALMAIVLRAPTAHGQTADELTRWIERLVDFDSADLTKNVKFRAGLEPPLFAADADESSMTILTNPFEVQGRNQAAAAGWYRVSFVVPEKLGSFAIPATGYKLGVESNVLGSWEIYSYVNGTPAGSAFATGVPGSVQIGNTVTNSRQHATAWMSNAPLLSKPGDKITVAILAMSSPLGRGSSDGYALRFLRLRFAQAHTFTRQPFYGSVTGPGAGTGLLGAREMLAKAKGDELTALQARLKGPLARLETLVTAAETEQLDELTKAMKAVTPEINQALKRPMP